MIALLILLLASLAIVVLIVLARKKRGASSIRSPKQLGSAIRQTPAANRASQPVALRAAAYDRSVFSNDAGGFTFPKYGVRSAWVSIADNTPYREIWSELDRDEKKMYSIIHFEEQFQRESLEFEVRGFWGALQGAKKLDLGDLGKLAGHSETLQALWEEQFENPVGVGASSDAPEPRDLPSDLGAELLRLEVVTRHDLSDTGNLSRWLLDKTLQRLKEIASDRKLAISGTKAELARRICESPNTALLSNGAYFCSVNLAFPSLIDRLSLLYAERIKTQILDWHPLHRQAVLEAAVEENQHSAPAAVSIYLRRQ